MRSLHDTSKPVALLAGLSLAGALAGCAPISMADTGSGTTNDAPASTPGDGTYVDGTYSGTGSYQSPNGTETIDVTITLADDVITDVQVVGHGESPDSRHYQGEFIGGIGAVVVGKDIDDIQVSKVAGSSLTSSGFNRAVEAITADAAA